MSPGTCCRRYQNGGETQVSVPRQFALAALSGRPKSTGCLSEGPEASWDRRFAPGTTAEAKAAVRRSRVRGRGRLLASTPTPYRSSQRSLREPRPALLTHQQTNEVQNSVRGSWGCRFELCVGWAGPRSCWDRTAYGMENGPRAERSGHRPRPRDSTWVEGHLRAILVPGTGQRQ